MVLLGKRQINVILKGKKSLKEKKTLKLRREKFVYQRVIQILKEVLL